MSEYAWEEQGSCRSVGGDLWFSNGQGQGYETTLAKSICRDCPVLSYCRIASIGEGWGVWGGLAQHERRSLRYHTNIINPSNDEAQWAREMRDLSDLAWREQDPIGVLERRFGPKRAASWLGQGVTNAE